MLKGKTFLKIKKLLAEIKLNSQIRGFTLIELIVVVAIMAILATLSLAFFAPSQRKTELRSSAEIIEASVVKANEMAKSPKPSGDLSTPWDTNGYGIFFSRCDCTKSILFKDVVDTAHPENMNKWVEPNDTDVDDVIQHGFDLYDANIENAGIEHYSLDGVSHWDMDTHSIVFKYDESSNRNVVYFDGVPLYSEIEIVLKAYSSNDRVGVLIITSSGKVELNL